MSIFGSKQEFYIFANNSKINYENIHIAKPNSTLIFFNDALPLAQSTKFDQYNKWIFFRATNQKDTRKLVFKDLSLLSRLFFEKFFFIPDLLDIDFTGRDYRKDAETILSKYDCIKNLSHLPKKFSKTKILEYASVRNINLSSGIVVYLYVKLKYPKSKITLVGFNSDIDSKKHNSNFEKGFLISEILNRHCESIKCF